MRLIRAAYDAHLDRLVSDERLDEYAPGLMLSVNKYQQFRLTNPLPGVKSFAGVLDDLIERYIQTATYHIAYYRRFTIKEWPYADIVPLDVIGDDLGSNYRDANRTRLAHLRPPTSFMTEVAATCRHGCAVYQYKNKIYSFNFTECSDGTTGTWGCWQAGEIPTERLSPTTQWGYINWPNDLGIKLERVPTGGVDVPPSEYAKHREFYTALLQRSRFMYKDGHYIFQSVMTTYR